MHTSRNLIAEVILAATGVSIADCQRLSTRHSLFNCNGRLERLIAYAFHKNKVPALHYAREDTRHGARRTAGSDSTVRAGLLSLST